MVYIVALLPSLCNLHSVFHVSQLWKNVLGLSHTIQMDDVQMRDNLIMEASQLRIDDRKGKYLRGNEIDLVKIVCVTP